MRALALASALVAGTLASGCTWLPDVSDLEPKRAEDCPGQKACGYRCVDLDDPAAGCVAGSCTPCPAGPANTVAVCGERAACGHACAPGFADCDALPGCERAVSSDPASCGACGRACPAGVACVDGACQDVTQVADAGDEPRGLAVGGGVVAWVTDPPVAGGVAPQGALHRVVLGGATLDVLSGFGHPTFVRTAGGPAFAVAGTDPDGGGPLAWLVDTSVEPPEVLVRGGGQGTGAIVGLALLPDWVVTAVDSEWDLYGFESYDGNASAIGTGYDPLTGLGEGGGFLWLGAGTSSEPGRVYRLGPDEYGDWSVVSGGGVYFDDLPPGIEPIPSRIAARADPDPQEPITIWFADLRDGSIWTGRTTGPDTAVPWRLVRGDGRPRTAMDVAADDAGVVWSDLEAGEIWGQRPDGQVHRVATGVRPWGVALTADRVYFTDVGTNRVLSVAR